MTYKKFNVVFFITAIVLLVMVALPTIIVDPLFHYHKPLAGVEYKLNDERYQNNGIVRNFDYNAIITGTSMTENFRTSEMNQLFDVNAIKVPFNGGMYKEINDNLLIALENNPDIKMIIVGIDYSSLIQDKDAEYPPIADAGYQYPWYLLDKNVFNDVSYFFNKTILLDKTTDTLRYTKAGGVTTTFDDYAAFGDLYDYGLEAILKNYTRGEKQDIILELTEEEAITVRDNVVQNVVDTARAYPDVSFYVFIPPYSICYWDVQNQCGNVQRVIDVLKIDIEQMININNIKVFAFSDREDIVCNLDNYLDILHYGPWINSEILYCMKEEKNMITSDNYQDYIQVITELYMNYDYDAIYCETKPSG